MIFQDDELDDLLRTMHRQWRRARVVRGAGRSLSLGCILLLLACLLDYWVRPPYAIRILLTLTFYGVVLAHIWRTWLRHYLEPFNARRIAWRIENRYPTLNEKLVSAVELAVPDPNVSVVLVDWLRVDAQFDLASFAPERTFPLRWHSIRVATTLVLAIALGMLISPTRLGRSVPRILFPAATDATAGPFTLNIISPGDGIFHEGSRVSFVVQASDLTVHQVELFIEGEQIRTYPMRASANTGHHSHLLSDIRQPFRYWAQSGSVRSPVYQVDVAKRPRVESYQLTLAFPAYTGQPPVTTTSDTGDITALVGTRVSLQVDSSQPLRRLDCVYDGQTLRGALSRGGRRAEIQLTVGRSGDFAIRLTDLASRTNRDIATIHSLPDDAPTVTVLTPPADLSANADDAIPIVWTADDDFAVEAQRLVVDINGRSTAPTAPLSADSRDLVLDLAPLSLRAGDLVSVRVEVQDGAGQITQSAPRYIQIGSARRLRPALPFLQAMTALHNSLAAASDALPHIRVSLDHIRSMETASQIDREHHLATLAQRRAQLAEALTAASNAAGELRNIDLFNRAAATAALLHAVLEEQRLYRLPELEQGTIVSIDTALRQTAALAEELETRAHLHIARHTLPLLASRLSNLGDDPTQAAQVHERAQRLAESANLEPADLATLERNARRRLDDYASIEALQTPLLAQHRGSEAMLSALADSLPLQPAAWSQVLDLADDYRERDELIASVLADSAKLRRPGSIAALARHLPIFERHQSILALNRDIERFAEFASTRTGTPARPLADECRQFRERPLPLTRLSQLKDTKPFVTAVTKAASDLEHGKNELPKALDICRQHAAALLVQSQQEVQRSRRELLRYTEPPSVALQPLARQVRAIASRLASQPSMRRRHEARDTIATIVSSLERLAGDLSEATVTDLRDPRAHLLLASDRLALAIRLRGQIASLNETRETLDSAPGASAERLRRVSTELEAIAESASHFERSESGLSAAPESLASSIELRRPAAADLGQILPLAALQRERRALEPLLGRIDDERPADEIRLLARRVATLLDADGQTRLLITCSDMVLEAHDATTSLLNNLRQLHADADFSARRQTRIDNTLALLEDATEQAAHVLALFERPYLALAPQVRDIRDRYRRAARDESVGELSFVIASCTRIQSQLHQAAASLPVRHFDFATFAAASPNVDPEAITVPLVALDDLIDQDDEGERATMMLHHAEEIAELLAESPTSVAEYAGVIAQRLADNVQFAEFATAAENIDALWRSVPALATSHNLGYQGDSPERDPAVTVPRWSRLPQHARLGVCLAFAQKQVSPELAQALAERDFEGAANLVGGPARASFQLAAELIELSALSNVPDSFAQPPEGDEVEGFNAWPYEAFLGAAIADALGNEIALFYAKRQDFAAASQAMAALAAVHADPLPAQFAEQGADWFTAAESALAEFAFRGDPPADLPEVAHNVLQHIEGRYFRGPAIAYLAGAVQQALYTRDYLGAAAALDAIAASPTPFAEFARTSAEALRLAHRDAYSGLSPTAITGLQLLDGGYPQVEAAVRYGNVQLAAVLARRHGLPMVAGIFDTQVARETTPSRAAGLLEQGFASLDGERSPLPGAVREAIGRGVLELAGASGVLADPRGSRPRARARVDAGMRHLLLARELLARELLDTLLVRPKAAGEDPQNVVLFEDDLAPVVHGLDGPATKTLNEAAADAHDRMGRHVDYSLFFRRANRRYLERLAAESRKWQR